MSASSSQQTDQREPAGKRQPTGDYDVGYCRPPKHTRFKPGHKSCGGRRRGSLDPRAIFDRAMKMKVPVRKGNKTQTMPAFQAIAERHTLSAVQGNERSLAKVIDLGTKLRFFTPQDETCDQHPPAPASAPAAKVHASDDLVESVDHTRLERKEQAELARLAELIDRDGDVVSLSLDDLVRLQQLITKGRGKDVAPQGDRALDQGDDSLDEAA